MTAENELRLEVAAGRAQGFSLVVDERLVIGRNSEGPGRLAGDPELSRHHAEIVRAPNGEFTINDLSSTNGTFVNGNRLNTPAVLTVGDEIGVGASKLVVSSAPVAATPALPDVDARAVTAVGGLLETIRDPAETAPVRTEPESPVRGPLLTVRLTVDFERETAWLSVDGTGEPIQLVLEHGRWRADDRGS
ncbi:MAG: FHA domain-containing protein [Solirubrobacteraceae bacterium]